MNFWFILAQVLGVITIAFEFTSYQIKDKSKYFLTTGIGSFFWLTMFFCMGMATGMDTQVSLMVAATYSTIRNLVFWRIFAKNTPQSKELGINFLLVMVGVALVAGTLAIINSPEQVRWLHTLGMIAALSFVIGQYLPGVHYVRVTVTLYALVVILTQTPLNILYGDFRWNIMGIAIELAKISSVAVFYLRFSKNPKQPQLQFAKP
ncbi:MAG: YgjV family protein [Defluviitaleaceae bacterium]|nr:YgjV family protein [Defluviitaleaceae bacterium]